MSEQLNEFLSAAVDGEAEDFELRRVFDEVGRKPALVETWNRYHVIGDGIRNELSIAAVATAAAAGSGSPSSAPVSSPLNMADAVWQAVYDADTGAPPPLSLAPTPGEERPQIPRAVADDPDRAPGRSWGGLAVAAAVSLVAIGAVLITAAPGEPTPTLASTEALAADIRIDGPEFTVTTEISASDLQRANAYMLHHVQQKAMNQPGVASFVKVVTFEAPQ